MKLKLLFAGLVFSAITANAQLATINQQFESFTIDRAATWPQFDWNRVPNPAPSMGPWVYADGTTDKFVYYYSFFTSNAPGYVITPQIVAPDGTKTLTFKASSNKGPSTTESATIEIGMVDGPLQSDMASFTAIGSPINLGLTEAQYTVTIPSSTKQYIAIKMTGGANHVAISLDEVIYDLTSVLGTSDVVKSSDQISFAVNTQNTALQFVGKVQPKTVEIYSAAGQQVAAGKVNNSNFDISTLQSGVYYILIETTEGKAIKSKFIKK